MSYLNLVMNMKRFSLCKDIIDKQIDYNIKQLVLQVIFCILAIC